jgi:SAM-dependent MidA family methyltransferase
MSSRASSLSLPEPPAELAESSARLGEIIRRAIEDHGPMPFDRFMEHALYEPGLGYYVNGLHRFGAGGDFVTAPEQGGLFAAALARQLDEIAGALTADWTLVEVGAGSGVLARDLLGGLSRPPERYRILEASAPLRAVQAETLAELPNDLRERVDWIDRPPAEPFAGVVIANEVVDALPIARFRLAADGPLERCVTMDGGRFAWTDATPRPRLRRAIEALQASLPHTLPVDYESDIALDAPGWLAAVTEPLSRGLALLIDYGYPAAEYYHPDRAGGTLVCHYRHRAHFDPFVWPGLTDLSAFVDFTRLAHAGVDCGLEVAGFTSQAGFLLGLGAHERVAAADDDAERLRLAGELKRLTLPGEMGEKFKVLGLSRGFDERMSGFELMSQLHRL